MEEEQGLGILGHVQGPLNACILRLHQRRRRRLTAANLCGHA